MSRAAAILCVAVLAAVSLPAAAAPPDDVGWWWRAQAGLPLEVPVPPTAPAGGLVVGAAPDGATAVAALRFRLADEQVPGVLTLVVADSLGSPTIAACPASLPWAPVEAGAWDGRPTVDCDRARTTGSGDAAAWAFDLTGFAEHGVVDVVLLPDVPEGQVQPSAFEISFAAPGDDALAVTDRPSAPAPAPPGQPTAAPSPSPPPVVRPVAPPPPGRVMVPPPPPPAAPPAPEPPVVANPTDEPDEPAVATAPQPPTTREDETNDAAATATAALLLTSAGWLWFLRHGNRTAETIAGLGRHRRPRTGHPPPLI